MTTRSSSHTWMTSKKLCERLALKTRFDTCHMARPISSMSRSRHKSRGMCHKCGPDMSGPHLWHIPSLIKPLVDIVSKYHRLRSLSLSIPGTAGVALFIQQKSRAVHAHLLYYA